jgi:hypothetical protein
MSVIGRLQSFVLLILAVIERLLPAGKPPLKMHKFQSFQRQLPAKGRP